MNQNPAGASSSPGRGLGRGAFLKIAGGVVGAGIIGAAVADAASSGSGADARNQLTIVAPANAGGGWDGAAREAQQAMRAQGIVINPQVVNIPGAGGTIGLTQVASMDAQTTTLMVMGITMLGAVHVNDSDTDLTDVTPIARLTDDYDVVVVPAESEIQSLDGLMEAWRTDPKGFAFGGGSLGSVDQMIIARLAQADGIAPTDINYIAYSGGSELATSLLSGTIRASVSGYQDFAPQIEAGALRALAVSAPERVESIDLPTLKDFGFDVDLTNWRGIVAPPGITQAQRSEYEAIVTEMVETPEWRDALERNQWADSFMVGSEFEENLRVESAEVDQIWEELGY